jgi:hypothetical protein
MSARDRRLREAARERDRQESDDTDESSFDRGLRQAAERQRDSSPRRRPGRGSETGTSQPIDDTPSPSSGGRSSSRRELDPGAAADEPTFSPADPVQDDADTFDDIDTGGGGGGGRDRPSPEPEPEDEPSVSEQISDLEPGEVLRAGGSGGTGEPDVEVVSAGENIRDVREAQLIARTDLTRDATRGPARVRDTTGPL